MTDQLSDSIRTATAESDVDSFDLSIPLDDIHPALTSNLEMRLYSGAAFERKTVPILS